MNHKYPVVGEIYDGVVTKILDFGAFVEIMDGGAQGLVHISEIAPRRIRAVQDELDVGQKVRVKVLEIDTERNRIRLSIKAVSDHG